jgi:hypothetical protein
MSPPDRSWTSDNVSRRAAETFELFEAGVLMMQQTLRRRHPSASDEEIEELLDVWLTTRPGAEHGDGVGVPAPWPPR